MQTIPLWKHFFSTGLLLVLFPAMVLAGGPYTENITTRKFTLENASEGNNPQAPCYDRTYNLAGFYIVKDGYPSGIRDTNDRHAGHRTLTPGTKVTYFLYYDVNKPVTIKIAVRKCLRYKTVNYYGVDHKVCAHEALDPKDYNVGLLAETSHYKFTEMCKMEKQ